MAISVLMMRFSPRWRCLREWAESGESIDAFIDSLPPVYATPELRIACPDEEKFQIVDRVIADVRANPDQDQQNLADMDGIRVTGDEGWWLIRASNTGAQLVARAEGPQRSQPGHAQAADQATPGRGRAGMAGLILRLAGG